MQITVSESEGVGTRATYYEEAGALRDMIQNHLLQLLCLVAMEPPYSLDPDVVRNAKMEVLRCLRPIVGKDVEQYTVRAQYAEGNAHEQPVPGYRREKGVNPNPSRKPTLRSKHSSKTGGGPGSRFICAPARPSPNVPVKWPCSSRIFRRFCSTPTLHNRNRPMS